MAEVVIKVRAEDRASGPLGRIGGALGSMATVAGGIIAAGAITKIASGLASAGTAGLSFNNSMEQVTARLNAFTKDGAATAAIMDTIRERAAATPFAFEEMANAAAALMPAAKQSGAALEDLIAQAEILAASNPAEGLEGAAFSLKEALGGDFVSAIERFNLSRQYINQLKEEGVPNLEIISRAMAQMGLDTDLVSNLATTAEGRWSTFKDTLVGLAAQVTKPIFDTFSSGLGVVNDMITANMPLIEAMAATLAGNLQAAINWIGGPGIAGLMRFGNWFSTTGTAALQQFNAVLNSTVMPVLQQVSGWFTSVGLPAFQGLTGFITATVIPALSTFGQQVQQMLMGRMQIWSGFVTSTVLPMLQQFGSWFTSVGLPAIQSFVGFITSTVIPAFEQFSLMANQALVIGLQTAIGYITTTVIPTLQQFGQQVVTMAGEAWPMFIQAIQQAVTVIGTLRTAFTELPATMASLQQSTSGFLTGFQSGLARLAEFFGPTWERIKVGFQGFLTNLQPVIPAWQQFTASFQSALPGLTQLAGIIGGALLFALKALGEVLAVTLPAAGQAFADMFTFITGVVGGFLEFIGGAVEMLVGLFTNDLDAARVGAEKVFNGLKSIAMAALGPILNAIDRLKAGLASIGDNVPSWLIPGSPTPFERGLLGVAGAFNEMARQINPMAGAMGGLNGMQPLSLGAGGNLGSLQAVKGELAQIYALTGQLNAAGVNLNINSTGNVQVGRGSNQGTLKMGGMSKL